MLSLLRKYTRICSPEQRQSYKQDFNREYSEYRDLHARIDRVTRQFMELDTQLKQLHHESHKYKVRQQIKLDLFNVFLYLARIEALKVIFAAFITFF